MQDDVKTKEKTFFIIGGILLAIVLVVGILYSFHEFRFQNPVVFLPDAQNPINGRYESPVEYGNGNSSFDSLQEVSGGTATTAVSYEKALQLYSGQIMQFNQNCRPNPVIMTIPTKSVVMLDNRSQWQRSLIVGPYTYTIAPYDYVLASFNTPGQYGITCDSVQDVSIISVQ